MFGLSGRLPGFKNSRSIWDLWWKTWQWDKFLSSYFRFPLSVSSHWYSIFIRLSPTVHEYRNGLHYEIAPLARYTMNVQGNVLINVARSPNHWCSGNTKIFCVFLYYFISHRIFGKKCRT